MCFVDMKGFAHGHLPGRTLRTCRNAPWEDWNSMTFLGQKNGETLNFGHGFVRERKSLTTWRGSEKFRFFLFNQKPTINPTGNWPWLHKHRFFNGSTLKSKWTHELWNSEFCFRFLCIQKFTILNRIRMDHGLNGNQWPLFLRIFGGLEVDPWVVTYLEPRKMGRSGTGPFRAQEPEKVVGQALGVWDYFFGGLRSCVRLL